MEPFFDSGPRPDGTERRLLLLSYAFPPTTHIGAVRWYQMSKLAAQRGWSFDIIMTDLSDETSLDWDPLAALPPGVRLFGIGLREHPLLRVGSFAMKALRLGRQRTRARAAGSAAARARSDVTLREAARAMRRATLARLYFDQAGEWIERAVALGLELQRQQPYDAIVSSGPPHMVHVAARRIARFLGLPFVADLRDPIAFEDVVPPDVDSTIWRQEVSHWEELVAQDADIVAVNTEEVRKLLIQRYPEAASRIIAIRNGADTDFRLPYRETSTFLVAHTGSIYWGRDPRPILEAAGRFVQRMQPAPSDFQIVFTGDASFNGIPLQRLAAQAGLSRYFEAHAFLPRKKVLEVLGTASLVVLLPQPQWYSIPAKLYEYVQLRAWVLALCEPGSSVHSVLQGSTALRVSPSDVGAIESALLSCYRSFRASGRPTPVNVDGRFDRALQASKLFDAIEGALRR